MELENSTSTNEAEVEVSGYTQDRHGVPVEVSSYVRSTPARTEAAHSAASPPSNPLGPYASVSRREDCEIQALMDEQRCRMLSSPSVRARCFESANARYGACASGRALGPLIVR